MNHLISGPQLSEAMAVITAAVAGTIKTQVMTVEPVTHTDLLYYDTQAMMKQLQVTERTLQRYRKEGKIRFTVVGGRVYYPKNFLIRPGEDPDPIPATPEPPTMSLRQKIQAGPPLKPKSRIIDLVRVTWYAMKMISYKRRYRGDSLQTLHERVRLERRIRGCSIQLWPKKIRLTYIPIRRPRNPLLDF